jgi:hypothetical protein
MVMVMGDGEYDDLEQTQNKCKLGRDKAELYWQEIGRSLRESIGCSL